MNDPITVSSGYTYDCESLEEYFKVKKNPEKIKCPLTRCDIFKSELKNKTNVTIRDFIEEFLISEEKQKKPFRYAPFFNERTKATNKETEPQRRHSFIL